MKGMLPLGFFSLAAQGAAEAVRCLAFLAGVAPRPLGIEHPDRQALA